MKKLLLSLLILTSPAAFAGNADQTIEAFLDEYIAAYNAYLKSTGEPDINSITDHFAEPALQIPPKGAPFFALEKASLNKNFSYFVNLLKKNGVARLDYEKVQIVKLTENNVLASNMARMFDKDGNIVNRSSSVYSVYRSDAGWKIVMIQTHPTESFPTLK